MARVIDFPGRISDRRSARRSSRGGNGRSATPPSRLYALIVLTALAMGLRNATVVGVLVATVAYPH